MDVNSADLGLQVNLDLYMINTVCYSTSIVYVVRGIEVILPVNSMMRSICQVHNKVCSRNDIDGTFSQILSE